MLRVSLIVFLLLVATNAVAGELNKIIETALFKSPEIRIAKKRLRITEYQYREAIGEFLPSINFTYSRISLSDVPSFTMSIPSLPPSEFQMIEKDYYQMSVSLKQPIFTGGYLTFNALKRRFEKDSTYYRFLETVNEVLSRVKNDYYTLSEAKTSIEIAKSFLKAAKEHYRDVKAFFEEGIVAKRDLLESEVKVREAEEKLERASSFYRISLEKLRKDVGDETLNPDVEELKFRELNISEENALKIAFENRPILKSLEKQVKGNKYGVKLSYSQFLPKVSISLSYDRTDQYPMNGNFKSKSAGVFLTIPIFEGTQRFWRVKQAREALTISKLSLADARRAVRLQVVSALSKLKSARLRIKTAKSMVQRSKELLRDSKERYREHVGTSTEVTDAIAYLVEAKGMLNSALADYNRAISDLEYAIGRELK